MAVNREIAKPNVLAALRARVAADLAAMTESQQRTVEGAVHDESRAENDKDTRALESTYLARGLAERVAALRQAASQLAVMPLRAFDAGAPVSLSALVELEDEAGARAVYFIAPAGGGVELEVGGHSVRVISPSSPVGRSLLGASVDDEVELRTPRGQRAMTIARVW